MRERRSRAFQNWEESKRKKTYVPHPFWHLFAVGNCVSGAQHAPMRKPLRLPTCRLLIGEFQILNTSRPYDGGLQEPVGKTPIFHAMMQSVCRREERKGKRKGSSPIIKTLPFAVSFHFHSSIFFLFFSIVGEIFMRLLSSSYETTFVNNHTL